MTIAQLYQHLQTTTFSNLRAADKVQLVMNNPVVRISSRTEAEEYVYCMDRVPARFLTQATHCWALELGYIGRMAQDHPAADYLATQLLTTYIRSARKDTIKLSLQMLATHYDRYHDTPLNTTIIQLCVWLMNQQLQRNTALAADIARVAPVAPPLAEAPPPDVSRALFPVATARPQTNPGEEQQNARNRLQDIWQDDQANIARAIELSLQVPDTSSKEKEKIPLKDIVTFCNANRLFRYRSYDPIGQKWTNTYVDPEKAKKIQAILEEETSESTCNICMSAEGNFSCGDTCCAFRMCGNCFSAWFLKSHKCPGCRRGYIPIVTRSTGVAQATIATEESDEE